MSDWEVVSINKKKPKKDESEWEIAEESQPEAEPNYESKGFGGIASDAFNKAIETAIGIPSALMALPGEVYGAGKQVVTEPKRALQNVGAGFGELGHGILSAPANVRDYLQRKDIVSENAPSFRLPESVLPKEYNYAEALGAEGEQAGDVLLRGLPKAIASAPLLNKIPGITNSAITKAISNDKKLAVQKAMSEYGDFFNEAKKADIDKITRPNIMAGQIIRHSQPKYHEALVKFMDNPTFENAHWAQSDLGFIKRHLQKVDEKQGLSSVQHDTLKNVIEAQNRIKETMFRKNNIAKHPELEQKYNQLSHEYKENVIPYKQLEELHDVENRKITKNNFIKALLSNDEFMLGLGKKYPQLQVNRALRSKPAKYLGTGLLGGLGFAEANKFLR